MRATREHTAAVAGTREPSTACAKQAAAPPATVLQGPHDPLPTHPPYTTVLPHSSAPCLLDSVRFCSRPCLLDSPPLLLNSPPQLQSSFIIISDGAAALVLVSGQKSQELGLPCPGKDLFNHEVLSKMGKQSV